MPRRQSVNRTGLERIEGVQPHAAWVGFVCLGCSAANFVPIGARLLDPEAAFDTANWQCTKCGYSHCKDTNLPFSNWPTAFTDHKSLRAERFWRGFFRIATEYPESYWKQCNTCGRILPFQAFSKHAGWGPLQRQMECRSCKGAIIELSRLTGADLTLLASREPIVNPDIDVNGCVSRFLKVRERSDLPKRLAELKRLLSSYHLVNRLSAQNRRLLGLD